MIQYSGICKPLIINLFPAIASKSTLIPALVFRILIVFYFSKKTLLITLNQ